MKLPETLYDIGQVVYHVTDTEKKPGLIVSICVPATQVIQYRVEWGSGKDDWYTELSITDTFTPKPVEF
jgi:hypothetical protein